MPPSDRRTILAAIRSLLDSLPTSTVVVLTPSGVSQTFQIPPTANAQNDSVEDTSCAEDIVYILGEAGRRLTTPEVLSFLERNNLIHGESTVKECLARLVREQRIDNRSDCRPRGYGILSTPSRAD